MKVSLALIIIVLLMGCAGARPKLAFDGAHYPLSMSQYLLDASGRVVEPKELRALGPFVYEGTGWAIGYTQIPLNKLDLSQSVNAAVEELGGEAIIQVQVTAMKSPCLTANTIAFGLNMIPLYPGCSKVMVSGLIVERIDRGERP